MGGLGHPIRKPEGPTYTEIENFRKNATISALQAVVEAKYGVLGEVDAELAAKIAIRLGNKLTELYFKENEQEKNS